MQRELVSGTPKSAMGHGRTEKKSFRSCSAQMERASLWRRAGEDATALLRKLGADEVIDPRSKGFAEQFRALVPGGVDAVLALAGGEALERCLDMMRAGGRVAYPNGVE